MSTKPDEKTPEIKKEITVKETRCDEKIFCETFLLGFCNGIGKCPPRCSEK